MTINRSSRLHLGLLSSVGRKKVLSSIVVNHNDITMQNSINQNFAPRSVSNDSQLFLLVIIIGGGIYGATLGLWRSSLQAILVAVKFPFLICLTMVGTGLINGMLAQVMGADISFRRCFQVTVRSYALLVIILESFVPLSLFILFNLPPMGSNTVPFAHSIFLSAHVILISFAGVLANLYLFGSLTTVCTTRGKALQIFFHG